MRGTVYHDIFSSVQNIDSSTGVKKSKLPFLSVLSTKTLTSHNQQHPTQAANSPHNYRHLEEEGRGEREKLRSLFNPTELK